MRKNFAVLGLGRFGESVVRNLVANDQDVLAVDNDEERVNALRDIATQTMIADTQDEAVLKELNIDSFDYVIIGIGNNMEASILTTLLVKELGARYVVAKAETEAHGRVLDRVCADLVIFPERDIGRSLVRRLLSNHILSFIDLSHKYTLAEIKISDSKYANRSLLDLNLRKQFDLNVIAIHHDDNVNISPKPQDMVQLNDILTVLGPVKNIHEFDESLGNN